jgi:hypothetical protein
LFLFFGFFGFYIVFFSFLVVPTVSIRFCMVLWVGDGFQREYGVAGWAASIYICIYIYIYTYACVCIRVYIKVFASADRGFEGWASVPWAPRAAGVLKSVGRSRDKTLGFASVRRGFAWVGKAKADVKVSKSTLTSAWRRRPHGVP